MSGRSDVDYHAVYQNVQNVIAVLYGEDRNRSILLNCHFDSEGILRRISY